MSATMTEKRKNSRGRPKGRAPTVAVQARISPELHEAFERMRQQTRRSVTVEIVVALEAHLAAAGFWPPKKKEG